MLGRAKSEFRGRIPTLAQARQAGGFYAGQVVRQGGGFTGGVAEGSELGVFWALIGTFRNLQESYRKPIGNP